MCMRMKFALGERVRCPSVETRFGESGAARIEKIVASLYEREPTYTIVYLPNKHTTPCRPSYSVPESAIRGGEG